MKGDNPPLPAARLRPADTVRLAAAGLRARPLRGVLSALGIALGIAAMLSVVGIAAASRAGLDRTLDRLGTNLLTAAPGTTAFGDEATLPPESIAMVARIGPVRSVSAVGAVQATYVYRSPYIPAGQTSGVAVLAGQPDLPGAVGARIAAGAWLNPATARYPAVVLGAAAARLLGVHRPGLRVWLGGQWFSVAGVLDPVILAPELDAAALVGWPAAERYLAFDGRPTRLYTRVRPDAVEAVHAVLAASANPIHPDEVRVSRPSDALAAQRATNRTLSALLLGLGAVALLVGGIGVANTMAISVLERRAEVGLRRALGATRGHIRVQFLAESLVLATLGGVGGVLLGAAVTASYATVRGWPIVLPAEAVAGGLAATLVVGVLAGVYPAERAARSSPTETLTD